jgi:hypothetical protein
LARARKAFKDVFATELADHSARAERAFAERLLDEAAKDAKLPTDCFVLLVGAAEAARDAADLPLCFGAVDKLSDAYDLDGLHFKADCAMGAQLKGDSPASTAQNCRAVLQVVDQLTAIDDYATVSRLLAVIRPAAGVDPSLNQDLQNRSKEVEALRVGAEADHASEEKLKTTPNDPAANLVVGSFLCLTKGDWQKGLPMLALGSDTALQSLAKEELAGAKTADALVKLADGWWGLAINERDPRHHRLIQHAAWLYIQAKTAGLTGLHLVLADRRIAEAGESSERPGVVNLLNLIDPVHDTVSGKWRLENGSLISGPDPYNLLRISYAPPEEYDFHIQFTRMKGHDFVAQILCHAERSFTWYNGLVDGTKDGFEEISGKYADQNVTSVAASPGERDKARVHDSLVQVRKGYIAAYVDGQLVARHETDFSDMGLRPKLAVCKNTLGLVTYKTVTSFKVIELIEVTGIGHPLAK